jgi:hypothetical protein
MHGDNSVKSRTLLVLAFWAAIGVACTSDAPLAAPIEFRRSGGIVGLDDLLTIDAKGYAQLTRRTGKPEFDLAPGDFARLTALLRDANFKSIPEDSRRKPYLVPDEISYVIVYQGHTVKTSDTAIPEKLQPVIQMMNGILDAKSR